MFDVMIVEDEVLVLLDLAEMVEGFGHTIHSECTSLDDGFEALEHSIPDVALLDINVARRHVWPLATALRNRGCRIVFLSADLNHRELREEFADCGRVEKPATLHDIREALEKISVAA